VPSLALAFRIARVFGITIDDVFECQDWVWILKVHDAQCFNNINILPRYFNNSFWIFFSPKKYYDIERWKNGDYSWDMRDRLRVFICNLLDDDCASTLKAGCQN
jgi:DNA-binding XRE family transcriptional regulator